MRLKIILGTALSALLLTSSLTQAPSLPTTQLAAAESTPPAESKMTANQAAPRIVWYNDPISLGLVVFALFAAIDIAILFAKNSHHTSNRHALR